MSFSFLCLPHYFSRRKASTTDGHREVELEDLHEDEPSSWDLHVPSAEPNLSHSLSAAHHSPINTETGGLMSYSSHRNGSTPDPPRFLLSLGHLPPPLHSLVWNLWALAFNKKSFSCLLSCWVPRKTCGMFVFCIIYNSDCYWRNENRIVRFVSRRCAGVGETVTLKQLIF